MCSSRIFFLFTVSFLLVSIEAPGPNGSTEGDTKKYDPLYVIFQKHRYIFVDSIKYNSVMKGHIYETSKDKVKMQAACPIQDTPTDDALLEIIPVDEKTLDEGYKCDAPIKFFTKQQFDREHFIIGFMIYDTNHHSGHISILPQTPWSHFPISLIKIAYKKLSGYRSITSWHDIKFTDTLPLDEDPDQDLLNNSVYEKNVGVYGYDIDPAYEEENQKRFVKEFFKEESASRLVKLQLAPSADFYFGVWKLATRSNINTTPIWQELVEEWQQLERFIRQISKVLGELRIVTGGFPPATIAEPGIKDPVLIPFYENPNKKSPEKTPVPMFLNLYKAVIFNQKRTDENAKEKWIRYGILFEMRNDPRVSAQEYNEMAVKNGWDYLGKLNNKTKTRFNVYELNPDNFKKLNVDHGEMYRPFDLNEVVKLWRDEQGREFERKVNVLQEMGLKKSP